MFKSDGIPLRTLSSRRRRASGWWPFFFPSRQIDWMTLDLPKRTKLKRRRWAKLNERRIIFRWVILGHKISDWSIHPVFPFRLNEEHVPCGHFFHSRGGSLYFSACFRFTGCFINFTVFFTLCNGGSIKNRFVLMLSRSKCVWCNCYFGISFQ